MPDESRRARLKPLPLLALLGLALVLLALLRLDRPARRGSSATDTFVAEDVQAEASPARSARGVSPGPAAPAAGGSAPGPEPPAQDCVPRSGRRCVTGDVHHVDSCGVVGEKREECGDSLCRDGRCLGGDSRACAELALEGACDGDTVRGCVGGVPYARDCAAVGKRCVMGHEGAQCRAPDATDCGLHGRLPRCDGERLLSCADGRVRERDCAALGARCVDAADAPASCLRLERLEAPPEQVAGCGACGCPPRDDGEERCDGHDNDADGRIDEGAECEPLDLVAFLVTDGQGRGSHAREDVEIEIGRINAVLGIEVALADVVMLQERDWLEVGEGELGEIVSDPRVARPRERVHVPVVFTDEIVLGDAPKAGIATLPNGRCGGRRVSDHPEPRFGGVVVAKGRSPTTTAHEIGHYLGLCHTHFELDLPVVRELSWPQEGGTARLTCPAECLREGDGICDTPPDPGPEQCRYDQRCATGCAHGESPDATNAMSYYTACRTRMSPGQVIEMRRSLELRRQWHPCMQPGGCPCVPGVGPCPPQMTCRPATDGAFECGLDGPLLVGEECEYHVECGGGAICAAGRCRIACQGDREGCRCRMDERIGMSFCTDGRR